MRKAESGASCDASSDDGFDLPRTHPCPLPRPIPLQRTRQLLDHRADLRRRRAAQIRRQFHVRPGRQAPRGSARSARCVYRKYDRPATRSGSRQRSHRQTRLVPAQTRDYHFDLVERPVRRQRLDGIGQCIHRFGNCGRALTREAVGVGQCLGVLSLPSRKGCLAFWARRPVHFIEYQSGQLSRASPPLGRRIGWWLVAHGSSPGPARLSSSSRPLRRCPRQWPPPRSARS